MRFTILPSFLQDVPREPCAIRMSSTLSKCSVWAIGRMLVQQQTQLFTFSLSLSLQAYCSSCLPYRRLSSIWWTRCPHTAVWLNYPKYRGTRFRTWMERVLWATDISGIWWPKICTGTSRCWETNRCSSLHINANMLCVTETNSGFLHLQFERDFRETVNMTAYEGVRIKTPLLKPSDGCLSRNFSTVRTNFSQMVI